MKATDNPGVFIPPPMIYAAFFGLASAARLVLPIEIHLFKTSEFHVIGWFLIFLTIVLLLASVWKFLRTRNTLVTIKPANSLQTTGIYSHTRNPMYLSLMFLYTGLACLSGNCWTLIFLPVLFLVIQNYVIVREEKYLERAFNEEYKMYKRKVRRWI